MAQSATRYPSPEPTIFNFFQPTLVQQFLEDHAGADPEGIEGGAVPAEEHKINPVSSDCFSVKLIDILWSR